MLPCKSQKCHTRKVTLFFGYLLPYSFKMHFRIQICITFGDCVDRIFKWISTEFQCYANWISMKCKIRCMQFQCISNWILQAWHAYHIIVNFFSPQYSYWICKLQHQDYVQFKSNFIKSTILVGRWYKLAWVMAYIIYYSYSLRDQSFLLLDLFPLLSWHILNIRVLYRLNFSL